MGWLKDKNTHFNKTIDKLKWIQFTSGKEDYEIELIFEGDRHHEIRLKKGMTPEQVAGVLLASHCELMSLKDDWNGGRQ